MNNVALVDLTLDEMRYLAGGVEKYSCALMGGFTAVALISGQWWAVAGGLIASYNSGCFE